MAFRDFGFPEVRKMLGVTVRDADLTSAIAPTKPRENFSTEVREGVELALAINTEKARSEFIIAMILMELRRSLGASFGLFSGIEFNVDPERGLNGVCDFILTKSPTQVVLTAPLISIVEAKNDNVHYGYGQCIAQMVAAWEFNQREKSTIDTIYGVVTTGTAWQFMQLRDKDVIIDRREYYVVDLGKIMGILAHMIRGT
jgi:hypothetical protein